MYRILVVDDDRDLQELYMSFLLKDGYQVVIASNGEEGLGKILRLLPDLVVMDISMPKCNGRDMLMKLHQSNCPVPVVIVSGKIGMKNDPEIQMCSQVQEFFAKPLDWAKFRTRIKAILQAHIETRDSLPNIAEARTAPPKAIVATDQMLGRTIGGCTIQKLLGEGGCGRVYKGLHQSLNIFAAIKVLAQELGQDAVAAQRFLREGKVLAHIDHPNVARILNMGQENGQWFIIMRYIEGDNLVDLIKDQRPIPLPKAVEIALQVAFGLQAAHKLAIVHRDIKPSNIIIEKTTGQAKIVDFGLAKRLLHADTVTRPGMLMGTPYYMSPEQCLGEELDARTDIYSLGATLYHMLTGLPPFTGSNALEIINYHVHVPPVPPIEHNAAIPIAVSDIVMQMLAKERDQRFANIEELLTVLQYSQG